jgi:dimethylaniline monooxygenase (N-oxide forming)
MGLSRVVVIGSGVTGLVTLKNLLEEGFDATAFDDRNTIRGVWKYSDGKILSVLETTVSNKSRFKNSYTDFPYPKNSPAFPTALQVHKYLESYADEFDLLPHIHLQTKVLRVTRNDDDTKWTVHLQERNGSETATDFDKVAVCSGEWGKQRMPLFSGRDLFKGEIIHAQAFKRPSDFKGKAVTVLGLGNNAADIATALVGHASKIYLAHRRGANLVMLLFHASRFPANDVTSCLALLMASRVTWQSIIAYLR